MDQLSPEDYLAVPDRYKERRECVHCGKFYYEYDNLGQHLCRLHTGVIQYREGRHYYSCCQQPWETKGCTRADHMNWLPSSELVERETQLRQWLCLEVPMGLFLYGLKPPRVENIVLRIEGPTDRRHTKTLRFANRDLTLNGTLLSQRIAQGLAQAPLLQKVLIHQSLKDKRREETLRALERVRRPQQGPLQEQEETQVPTQFIPFLVLTRFALSREVVW